MKLNMIFAVELTTEEAEKELEKIRLDTVADLREGLVIFGKRFFGDYPHPTPLPPISGSASATVTGNRTLIIAMTGRNALSIELIKPTGEQAIVSYSLEKILKHEWHID